MKQADKEFELVRRVWEEIPTNTYSSPHECENARLKRMCELTIGLTMAEAKDIYETYKNVYFRR